MTSSFLNQERSASMGEDIRKVDPSLHVSQSSRDSIAIDVSPELCSGVYGELVVRLSRESMQLFWPLWRFIKRYDDHHPF